MAKPVVKTWPAPNTTAVASVQSVAGRVLLAAGVATVANPAVTANSYIFLSYDAIPGSNQSASLFAPQGLITPGVNFGIAADNASDTGFVNYVIVNRSDNTVGTTTMVAGQSFVSTTAVKANSVIFVSGNTQAGTTNFYYVPSNAIKPGVGFSIYNTSSSDTSTVNWIILPPAGHVGMTTLTGATNVINNNSIQASSFTMVCYNSVLPTLSSADYIGCAQASNVTGTSFTIASNNSSDRSIVNYWNIINGTSLLLNTPPIYYGWLPNKGYYVLPNQTRSISITSANDLSAATFTVTGYDSFGTAVTSTHIGPTAGATVYTTGLFHVITAVYADRAVSAVSIGTGQVGSLSWVPIDSYYTISQVAVQTVVTGTINYTVNQTLDLPQDTISGQLVVQTPTAFPIPSLNNDQITPVYTPLTALSANSFYAFPYTPVSAVQCVINSATGGSLVFTVLQQGVN